MHVTVDPLLAQGANVGSYSAFALADAIQEATEFDLRLCQDWSDAAECGCVDQTLHSIFVVGPDKRIKYPAYPIETIYGGAMNLSQRPQYGQVSIVRHQGYTDVHYRPSPGYVGPDSFSVLVTLYNIDKPYGVTVVK